MPAERIPPAPCRLARALTLTVIVLTATIALLWSREKHFWVDEVFEFQTDSVASLRELVHVQSTWPISLDPLLYHALSHGAMKAFGATVFVQRLPALAGFLLMQVCLFFFVRRLRGERAGAVAATFPALTATLYYAVEGRPYGLLLGLYALALLCWQQAAEVPRNRSRALPLVGLALSLAATLNTHYFGVLLLLPIAAAELWRIFARRRLDWPMLTAIAAGGAAIVCTRPFMKAASAFRAHYYNGGSVGLRDITRAYRSMFVDYTSLSLHSQRLSAILLVLLALTLIASCWPASRRRDSQIDAAQWVLLIVLSALPFAGYLLARFVTHSIEVRYVLGALVGTSVLIAIAIADWLESDLVFSVVMFAMGATLIAAGTTRIHAERTRSRARVARMVLPDAANVFLREHPNRRFYVQDMGTFEEDRSYVPDPYVQQRMTLVYSADEELRWNGHDTMALTATHLQHFTSAPIEPYEQIRAHDGEQLFLLQHTGWDWTDQALKADGATVHVLGQAFGGNIALVRFH